MKFSEYNSKVFVDQHIDSINIDTTMEYIPLFCINGLELVFSERMLKGAKDLKELLKNFTPYDSIKNNLNIFLESSNINFKFPSNPYSIHSNYSYSESTFKEKVFNLNGFSNQRYGSKTLLLNRFFIFNNTKKETLFFMAINKKDIALYKKCLIFGDDFPNNKLYIFKSTPSIKKATGVLGKYVKRLVENLITLNKDINVIESNDLNSWLFAKKRVPKLNTFKEKREFEVFIKEAVLNNYTIKNIPDNFKKSVSLNPAAIKRNTYSQINNRIIIKTMRTINIKKSELATLIGLGETSAKIAQTLQVDEKDVKEAMITFGITKSRKAPKNYIINLEEDV